GVDPRITRTGADVRNDREAEVEIDDHVGQQAVGVDVPAGLAVVRPPARVTVRVVAAEAAFQLDPRPAEVVTERQSTEPARIVERNFATTSIEIGIVRPVDAETALDIEAAILRR